MIFGMFCNVCYFLMIVFTETSSAMDRISVPEEHSVYLRCGDSDDVIWTQQDRKVIVTKQGNYETNQNRNKYSLLSNGSLCIKELEKGDSGEYSCNGQLVAEVEVLTGYDFTVSAGRTLVLPCRDSSKHKQRWYHRKEGERRRGELILTRFKNGTVKREREDSWGRYSDDHGALQILNLQPSDTGQYLCNGNVEAQVTVVAMHTGQSITQFTPTTTFLVTRTDVVEWKNKEKSPENILVIVALLGLGVMTLLMGGICMLLSSTKCTKERRNKSKEPSGRRQEDTELQPWKSSHRTTESEMYESQCPAEDYIHYASLARQNWRGRPIQTLTDQNSQDVIYSSVITAPTGK